MQCQSPASPLAVTIYVASSLLDCQCTLITERASFEIFLISGLQGAETFHINSISTDYLCILYTLHMKIKFQLELTNYFGKVYDSSLFTPGDDLELVVELRILCTKPSINCKSDFQTLGAIGIFQSKSVFRYLLTVYF